jgi:hypothetical protein
LSRVVACSLRMLWQRCISACVPASLLQSLRSLRTGVPCVVNLTLFALCCELMLPMPYSDSSLSQCCSVYSSNALAAGRAAPPLLHLPWLSSCARTCAHPPICFTLYAASPPATSTILKRR